MEHALAKRLRPLYIASFSQGLVFWYAIEKVFMTSIGFKPSSIVVISVIYSISGLLLDVPSGILADRWSRKGVLMVSCVIFILGTILLGLSHTVIEYVLASIVIGTYFALSSGMYDSMIYDTLIEETGSRKHYEKYYGTVTVLATLGIASGGLLSGFIGKRYGLSVDYFISIPGSIIALCFLFVFKEPKLHKQVAKTKILKHFSDTLVMVIQKGERLWIFVSLVAFSLVLSILLQVGQLWALALALPLVLYGPLDALLLIGVGLGAYVAHRISRNQFLVLGAMIAVGGAFLLTIRSISIMIIAQFVSALALSAITIVLSGKLHDTLPSNLRSGSSSMVETLKTLLLIPLIIALGIVTQSHSVFIAAYILVALAIVGSLAVMRLKSAN